MIREVVHIDEELCNGCGDCVPNCHEGALQIIDDKARLISDLMCDGLGACLGHCPMGAISIEKREAEPYNETKVMEIMAEKGQNTVIAHLKHLKDHNEKDFLREGVQYLRNNADKLGFSVAEVVNQVHNHSVDQNQVSDHEHANAHEHEHAHAHAHAHQAQHQHHIQMDHPSGGGCPGSMARSFEPASDTMTADAPVSGKSELRQWPVQMHLINPAASYFQNSDVVLAADCVAFSLGDFHQKWLKGKSLAIACPKLDDGLETYVTKIQQLIDNASINTLTVMMMQVPCCGGLLQMAQTAIQNASRKIPVKMVVVGIEGEILQEEWV